MKKYHFIVLTIAIVLIMILMLIGNIIVIGEKITAISGLPILEYLFYLVILVLFFVIAVHPMIKIIRTPAMPDLTFNEDDRESMEKISRWLINHPSVDNSENKFIEGNNYQPEALLSKEIFLDMT
jgi:hypothetical protein